MAIRKIAKALRVGYKKGGRPLGTRGKKRLQKVRVAAKKVGRGAKKVGAAIKRRPKTAIAAGAVGGVVYARSKRRRKYYYE